MSLKVFLFLTNSCLKQKPSPSVKVSVYFKEFDSLKESCSAEGWNATMEERSKSTAQSNPQI